MDSSSFPHQLYDIIFSRKFLLQTPVPSSSDHGTDRDPSASVTPQSSLDANVVMIMAVLLCALICALGLNSIVRCALRCSIVFDSNILAARRANVGVKKKALETFPTLTYSTETNLPGLDTECAICLSEFLVGERIRVLPTCNHGFHLRCIDRWLFSHSSCPTCRQCLLNTCQKIVSCNQTSHSQPSSLTPEIVILPLEAEGFVPSYRVSN